MLTCGDKKQFQYAMPRIVLFVMLSLYIYPGDILRIKGIERKAYLASKQTSRRWGGTPGSSHVVNYEADAKIPEVYSSITT